MTKADVYKMRRIARRRSGWAADDRREMAHDLEQAGYVGYLSNMDVDEGARWLNALHEMTDFLCMWRYGVKRYHVKDMPRYQPLQLDLSDWRSLPYHLDPERTLIVMEEALERRRENADRHRAARVANIMLANERNRAWRANDDHR